MSEMLDFEEWLEKNPNYKENEEGLWVYFHSHLYPKIKEKEDQLEQEENFAKLNNRIKENA